MRRSASTRAPRCSPRLKSFTNRIPRGGLPGVTRCTPTARGPVEFASGLANVGIWGKELRDALRDYNFFGRVTLVGEVLPDEKNCVTLTDEVDEYGLRRAKVTFSYGENDNRKLIAHAVEMGNRILEAAGGKPRYVVLGHGSLDGGCRMGPIPPPRSSTAIAAVTMCQTSTSAAPPSFRHRRRQSHPHRHGPRRPHCGEVFRASPGAGESGGGTARRRRLAGWETLDVEAALGSSADAFFTTP